MRWVAADMRDLDRLALATLAKAAEVVEEEARNEAPWLAANDHHREHFARTGEWVATEVAA